MSDALSMSDAEFRDLLVAVVPHLRAFAYSLGASGGADDLAQEAAMKAWKARGSFQSGTNFKAWAFTILRNVHLSDRRRAWRNVPLEQSFAENTLIAGDSIAASEELLDVHNAMRSLPDDQREALALVGAAGITYEEAAEICGCAVGTIKSRVSRARTELTALMAERATGRREKSEVSSTQVLNEMMSETAAIRRRLERV